MSKGISDFQIENAIGKVGDEDLTIQLWCLLKLENIPSLLETLTAVKRAGHIGGIYLILNQEAIFFLFFCFFILLDLMVWNISSYRTTEK